MNSLTSFTKHTYASKGNNYYIIKVKYTEWTDTTQSRRLKKKINKITKLNITTKTPTIIT